ncbi:MAG TPA: GTPase HflX, partial [Negativicutes bacterium]|nr:GTPase HflX [Negativicutes bacterium]
MIYLPDIQGNLSGIRKSTLEILENLHNVAVPPGQAISDELAAVMAQLTAQLGREIAVYLTRRGQVVSVAVGDT